MAKIGYIRVSTDEQSLARQEALMEQIGPDKLYREKASGKDALRPELKAMLAYVREGDVLHVESISRLARSTRDLLHIVDQLVLKGVEFVSHKEAINTTTPQGRFVLTVFAALAELERETTLQRSREGIDAARKAGKPFGRPPALRPPQWDAVTAKWRAGEITATDARKRLGLKKSTFYKLINTL